MADTLKNTVDEGLSIENCDENMTSSPGNFGDRRLISEISNLAYNSKHSEPTNNETTNGKSSKEAEFSGEMVFGSKSQNFPSSANQDENLSQEALAYMLARLNDLKMSGDENDWRYGGRFSQENVQNFENGNVMPSGIFAPPANTGQLTCAEENLAEKLAENLPENYGKNLAQTLPHLSTPERSFYMANPFIAGPFTTPHMPQVEEQREKIVENHQKRPDMQKIEKAPKSVDNQCQPAEIPPSTNQRTTNFDADFPGKFLSLQQYQQLLHDYFRSVSNNVQNVSQHPVVDKPINDKSRDVTADPSMMTSQQTNGPPTTHEVPMDDVVENLRNADDSSVDGALVVAKFSKTDAEANAAIRLDEILQKNDFKDACAISPCTIDDQPNFSQKILGENATTLENAEKIGVEKCNASHREEAQNSAVEKLEKQQSNDNPTAALIKKQISEIEKELMRKIQNENIKKMNASEVDEFLSERRSDDGDDVGVRDQCETLTPAELERPLMTDSSNFSSPSIHSLLTAPQQYDFNNAAHLLHLMRLQEAIAWDGKLSTPFAQCSEKDLRTLAELTNQQRAAFLTPPTGLPSTYPFSSHMTAGPFYPPTPYFAHAHHFPQSSNGGGSSGHAHPPSPFAYWPATVPNVPVGFAVQPPSYGNCVMPLSGSVPCNTATVAACPPETNSGAASIVDAGELPASVGKTLAPTGTGLQTLLQHIPTNLSGHTPLTLENVQALLGSLPASNSPLTLENVQAMLGNLPANASNAQTAFGNFSTNGGPLYMPASHFHSDPRLFHEHQQNANKQPPDFLAENLNCSTAAQTGRGTGNMRKNSEQLSGHSDDVSKLLQRRDCGSLNNLQSLNSSCDDLTVSSAHKKSHAEAYSMSGTVGPIDLHANSTNVVIDRPTINEIGGQLANGQETTGNPARKDDSVESYVRKLKNSEKQITPPTDHSKASSRGGSGAPGDSDTDTETDNLLGIQRRIRKYQKIPTAEQNSDQEKIAANQPTKLKRKKEAMLHEPAVLIEGVLFRAKYLGSTQIVCDGRPTKASRMMQAQEAVTRIKVPDGECQPLTEVDLFISTEKIMVLNTDLQRISQTDVRQDIMMDHPLRTISYIADIADLVVLMARRVSQASPEEGESTIRRTPKLICHVFESDEAQFIAQSIGQAFQVAYMEFLRANGIEDPGYLREMDYQEVLNSQEMLGEELELFAKKETQKDVVVPKQKNEILGVVIVESGWGSMLPTVVVANLMPAGPAARCNQINVGDHIIALNGISFVGLPLSTCQNHIKNVKQCTAVKMTLVHTPPVVEVRIKRPDTKYQLGFSVQNGVICSLLRGGIAERGGIRVGHRIIEINGQSVVAVPHEKIVTMLATAVGEILMKTMPTSMFRLLTGQEQPIYL